MADEVYDGAIGIDLGKSSSSSSSSSLHHNAAMSARCRLRLLLAVDIFPSIAFVDEG
jgi:hypothetical protein